MTSTTADPRPNHGQGSEPMHPQDTGPNPMAEALRYALRGWRVFPVYSVRDGICSCSKGETCGNNAGKHPLNVHGSTDATTDKATIRRWWTQWPNASIGIATGKASDLFVLDVDPRHGGDDSLEALIDQHSHLPDTVEVLTGGDGRHIYFSHDGVEGLKNSSSKLGPGLDVKTDGGYVVAPPSMHASGRRYEWEASSHPGDTSLAPPPQWLVDALTDRNDASRPPGVDGGVKDPIDLAAALAGFSEGERDERIYEFACSLRARDTPWSVARVLVLHSAALCSPPFPPREAMAKLKGAWKFPAGTGPADEESVSETPTERFLIHWGNDIENLPSPEWLIDGIMTKGSFVVLYGPAGVGKSFVVLDMAGAIASGQPWQGHDTLKGPVVYIAAEGVGDLGLRHEALRIGRDLDDLPDVGYMTEPVNLYQDGEVDNLIDLIADRSPALIIADTLARSMDGADENFAGDMNVVIRNVDRLRHKTGAAVMLIHHTGQDTRRERGSTALKGAADAFIKLKGKVTDTVTMTCDKMKMSTPFDAISLSFEQTGQSLAVVSRGVTPTLTDHERESLTLVSPEPLTHKAWLEAFTNGGNGSKSTFDRAIKTLKEKGFAEGGGGIREDLYSITDTGRQALGLTGTNEVSGAK